MDEETKSFFRTLKALFQKLEHDDTYNDETDMIEIFLLHHGLKPGVLLSCHKLFDEEKLQKDFVQPMKDLLGEDIIVHIEYMEHYYYEEYVKYHSIWILTREIATQTKLHELSKGEIPIGLYYCLLGYPSDMPKDLVSYNITYNLILSGEICNILNREMCNILHRVDEDEITILSYGCDADTFKLEKGSILAHAMDICQLLATKKLGDAYFVVNKTMRSELYRMT